MDFTDLTIEIVMRCTQAVGYKSTIKPLTLPCLRSLLLRDIYEPVDKKGLQLHDSRKAHIINKLEEIEILKHKSDVKYY